MRKKVYKNLFLLGAVALCCGLWACTDDDDKNPVSSSDGDETAVVDGGEVAAADADPESAAGLQLVQVYAGTYSVTPLQGTHARGSVTISADGSVFDFDTGRTFTIEGQNVFNRIPNFSEEPRVQIEIPGTPQQRLRIFVDPADTRRPLRFTYDDNADDTAVASEVQVSP